MPADYTSTARALSISTSPGPFSPTDDDDAHPPWRHHRNQSANRHGYSRGSTSSNVTTSVRDQVVHRAAKIYRRLDSAWQRMSWWQRIGALTALLGVAALGLAFMIFTGQVFAWLGPVAGEWENSMMVFFILWLCVFFVSFPPLVGWSTFGTISGFIFGVWKGWLLYASGTVLGSVCSFIVSRTVLSKFVNRLMERDKRFAALALTLKYDGLKLLCMIRLCPLPYSICNGGVSTFPTVHPLMYGLATIIISPKLLVPTFIGSRLRLLSEKNEEMSLGSKAVNVGSIALTVAIGVFTGWYIYKRTLARAKELEAKERDDIRNSLQEDHTANRPHRRFSGDPNVNTAATTLARDEEERAGFHDLDDDNLDIVIGDDSDSDPSSSPKKTSPYHDEFTDNDSDVFGDGDGSAGETYQLHSQRSNSRSTSKPG